MKRKPACYLFAFVFVPVFLWAQQVGYSGYLNVRAPNTFRIIGKSGNNYWAEKERIRKVVTRHESTVVVENRQFMIFDSRLNLVSEMQVKSVPGTIREYLVSGRSFFDQLVLTGTAGKTVVYINRYSAEAGSMVSSRRIDSIPFSAPGSRFLLARSEDASKILLLGFEVRESGSTRIHGILFDGSWNILYHSVLEHDYFSQPCIQDEEVCFPAENFDDLPVKLANSGEWLMACSGMANPNYLLFHMYADGKSFYYQEIPLSAYYSMEDIAMSIDNNRLALSIGVLARYRNTSLKYVRVSEYSLLRNHFEFDSSYHFNALSGGLRNQNLTNESFISIPGKGCMLLKEYGRPSDFRDFIPPDTNPWDPVLLLANFSAGENTTEQLNKNGYTRKKGLQGIRSGFDRGNLTMFYFPITHTDSTWSGILNTEQHTELNAPTLSYLVFPVSNKIYIMYNSMEQNADEFSKATTLDTDGKPTDDPVIFWRMDKTLDFQKARRISSNEVAVPYSNNQQSGFALIKL